MFRRTFLALSAIAALISLASSGYAQEPAKGKQVTLRWFGQSFFQIEDSRGQRIVLDPHAIPTFGTPRVKADFVLISHPHNDHAQPEVLDGPPKENDIYRGVVETKPGRQEWKAIDEKRGQIRFRTLATYHDPVGGMQRGKNAVWIIEVDGLVFCHLGDLGHELTAAQVKAIGKVDVLMVPVGGIFTINGEVAKKVADQIKPRLFVLPMHYGVPGYEDLLGPEEFLDGQKNRKNMTDTNELVIPVDTKAPDAPTVVVLGWKKVEPVPAAPPAKK